jgi:hypothetical protein
MLTTNPSVPIYLHSEPIVTTTGRGCVSPPGLMNANLCGSIGLYCISGHVWPSQPSSLTRGRPPQPPRPLLPRPKPRWRRGAKRLDGADARTGGYGPLNPPAPYSPGQSPGGEGEPSGWRDRTPGPVVTITGRGCVSPPGLMNANLCGSIVLGCGLNDGSCFASGCEQSVVRPEGFCACWLCWHVCGL